MTPKQEAFARAYVECGCASEAYRRAGYKTNGMADRTLHVEASKLLGNPMVSLRIEELRREANERCQVSVERLTKELCAIAEEARNSGRFSAAVVAVMGIAKMHGFLDPDYQRRDGIPPLHERMAQFRTDPVITRPPVSGEITRLPPLDGAD